MFGDMNLRCSIFEPKSKFFDFFFVSGYYLKTVGSTHRMMQSDCVSWKAWVPSFPTMVLFTSESVFNTCIYYIKVWWWELLARWHFFGALTTHLCHVALREHELLQFESQKNGKYIEMTRIFHWFHFSSQCTVNVYRRYCTLYIIYRILYILDHTVSVIQLLEIMFTKTY